jgi:hypothetical protein
VALPGTVTAGSSGHVTNHSEIHSILNGTAKSAGLLQLGGTTPTIAFLSGTTALGDYASPNSATAGPAVYSWGAHRLGFRSWLFHLGPWMDSQVTFEASGVYSCTLNLQRDTINNDNSINFGFSRVAGNSTPNPHTQFVFEQAGTNDLVIKHVQGTPGLPYNASYTETFQEIQKWKYPASPTAVAQVGFSNANVGLFNQESWADTQFGGGFGVLYLDNAEVNPTTNPTAGGILYASGGSLFWRSSAGNVRTVAAV